MERVCTVCGALSAESQCPEHRRSGSTRDWRNTRTRVLARDRHRCIRCSTSKGLQVHHVDGDWRNDSMANLVTYCSECHRIEHGR